MVEPLLSGIVLGLIPVVISGLLTIAYLQFRRRDQVLILIGYKIFV
jgi:cytochrome b6-f complex subunit 5